jgi:hypothetical protein
LTSALNLEELRLENIGMKILPECVTDLTALDELTLRNNGLAALPRLVREAP